MANKCYQVLTMSGIQEDLKKIVTLLNVEKDYLTFSNLIPIPNDNELKKLQLSKAEWCEKNYGISCDFAILTDVNWVENEVTIQFHTNYSPCREFFHYLSQLYEDIYFTLHFYEPHAGFRGFIECQNGEVFEDVMEEIDWRNSEREKYKEENEKIEKVEVMELTKEEHMRLKKSEMQAKKDIEDFLNSI